MDPSKYDYISNIMEEEFESIYMQFLSAGTLEAEINNLVNHCESVFDELGFTEENEDSRLLRYAIIGSISEYETVKNELQQSTKIKG